MLKGLENINLPLRGFVRRFYVSNLEEFSFRRKRQYSYDERFTLKNEEEIVRGILMAHFPLLLRLLSSECGILAIKWQRFSAYLVCCQISAFFYIYFFKEKEFKTGSLICLQYFC